MTFPPHAVIGLVDDLIADARDGLVNLPSFRRQTDPRGIWFELAFCIASSQERARRAVDAAKAVSAAYDDLCASEDPHSVIRSALAADFVSLRFMNRKSEHLATSWIRFRRDQHRLVEIDSQFDSPASAREYLIEQFPGIGPKQASMLLRNVGWGSDLAIIDSHVARMSSLILQRAAEAETYHSLESRLREFAQQRQVSLEVLDVILWSCSRMVRTKQVEQPSLV